MRLSELKTGERGIIVKVHGHGGFRRRIVEMGFIRGKTVSVVLNAPLKDPIEYEIIGYKISLRREEASLVEVISEREARQATPFSDDAELRGLKPEPDDNKERAMAIEAAMETMAAERRKTIHVALVGNPNCGKTSLFNVASGSHEHVGNYSGVTVEARDGYFHLNGYQFHLIDLPGTYSLSTYGPEEQFVRRQLIEETPDVVLNVIDASNLERNLYLTTQLIDMNLPMVVALNMYDEMRKRHDELDYDTLGKLLGTTIVPTVSRSGEGLDKLFETIIQVYENPTPELSRHIHVNHGAELEKSIDAVKHVFQKNSQIRYKYSTRYLAIKFLEGDKDLDPVVDKLPNRDELIATRYAERKRIEEVFHESCESALTAAKYGFIQGALKETYRPHNPTGGDKSLTARLDAIVTHRWFGFPLFFVLLYLMFEGTFFLGDYPMQGIDWLVGQIGAFVSMHMADGPLKDMIVDGIIGGVGSVIVFLPNILILYLFLSLLEDSGYMARAAFIMDKVMHKVGLHGKSFIPMIMGFGCNVPAVMATRTIESPKSRLVTMLVVPLMSCSARLPIYVLLVGAFFPHHASLVMLGLYALGIFLAALMAGLFSRLFMRGGDLPFVMELPPYRLPTAKSVCRHTWEKGRQYLRKMGGIILVCSLVVWFLGYYPRPAADATVAQQQKESYIGRVGKAIEPVLAPLGFDWKMSIGIVTGVGAKELVVSTLGVIYSGEEAGSAGFDPDSDEDTTHLQQVLVRSIKPSAALAYLAFCLIYFPCLATLVAVKNESGHWRWAVFLAGYTTVLAWIVAFAVGHIAAFFM